MVDISDNSQLLLPANDMSAGSSMPMNASSLPDGTFVAVWHDIKTDELKFVSIDSKKWRNKYVVMLFMDNRLTQPEVEEWRAFSQNEEKFM